MSSTPAVLLAIATELAERAKYEMPKLRESERIQREWYKNGVYYRETTLDGETYQSQYDFRQRKSRRMAVVKK